MVVKEKKASVSDSNYVLKTMNEFTMMNTQEIYIDFRNNIVQRLYSVNEHKELQRI